jgi:hypothetical protein
MVMIAVFQCLFFPERHDMNEKMRGKSRRATAALSRQSRQGRQYQQGYYGAKRWMEVMN